MKKPITYLFSFLLVMFGLTANSQTTFTLDFSTKKLTNFENLDTLNKGDFYQVEIININTGIYKVLINKKDSVIQSAPVTMPDFASLSLEPLSKLIAGMSPVTAAATPVNPFKSRKDALEAIAENQKIADEINNTKRVLENKFQQLKGIKERIDNLNLRASKYILLGAMETKDSSVNSWTVTADKIADTITLLRIALIEFNKEEKSEKQYYELFSEKEADIIKENFADADGKIKASFKSMDEAIEAAQSLVSAEKATEILKSIIQVQNNAAFKYTSLPQQFNGDFNKLSITIESLKADVPTQKWTANYEFPVEKKRRYIGTGLAFYASGLYNEAFSSKAITDTTYQVVSENPGKAEIGMTVLLRYGRYFSNSDSRRWGYHFNIGPGISIADKPLPRILFGGGLSGGKRNKITFDAGIIAGHVQVQSKAYDISGTYAKEPTNVTVARLKVSWFCSVGYLFTF